VLFALLAASSRRALASCVVASSTLNRSFLAPAPLCCQLISLHVFDASLIIQLPLQGGKLRHLDREKVSTLFYAATRFAFFFGVAFPICANLAPSLPFWFAAARS
jgi:hypothetical protein